MLQENKTQKTIKVDVKVNPEKAKEFINELINLLNKYELDGISICNESIIQIKLDLMEYSVTPIPMREPIETRRDSLIQNIIK